MPSIFPSASMTAAVLWYRPLARLSKSEAITTTPRFFASFPRASVLGPGIVSASLKFSWSSLWQKYRERNSSCVQMAEHLPVRVDDGGRVVVQAARPPFEERGDHHDAALLRQLSKGLRAWARDRLRQPEVLVVLALAEIPRELQLLRADDVGAEPRGLLG